MKTKIILSIFFSIFFLVSCQEEIPLNLPDAEQLIVVNGVLMTDSTLSVNISKSINISNTDDFLPRINDATVKLYKNGAFLENLQNTTDGNYVSSSLIQDKQKYSVEILHNEITLNTEIDVPAKTYINEIEYLGYNENSNLYSCKLKISDSPKRDFYLLEPYSYLPEYIYNDLGEIDSFILTKQRIFMSYKETENPFYNFHGDLYPYFSGYIFNDSYFNNSEFEINFDISNYFYIDTSVIDFDSLAIYFKLIKIDSNIYNYFESKEKYYQSNENPFIEPVNIYSNIDGGAGVLGSLSSTLDSIKIKYIVPEDYYFDY